MSNPGPWRAGCSGCINGDLDGHFSMSSTIDRSGRIVVPKALRGAVSGWFPAPSWRSRRKPTDSGCGPGMRFPSLWKTTVYWCITPRVRPWRSTSPLSSTASGFALAINGTFRGWTRPYGSSPRAPRPTDRVPTARSPDEVAAIRFSPQRPVGRGLDWREWRGTLRAAGGAGPKSPFRVSQGLKEPPHSCGGCRGKIDESRLLRHACTPTTGVSWLY
jgi:hypothetical protein